jgi:prepilin-type N-terminal cleavage/methylation domain-containing protein
MKRLEHGFTLLELMVVIVVIGILASIAIRQITVYQARAFNSRAETDLRNAVAAQEAYYADNEHYTACANSECEIVLGTFRLSDGIQLMLEVDSEGDGFQGEAYHPRGDKRYRFDSDSGVVNAL